MTRSTKSSGSRPRSPNALIGSDLRASHLARSARVFSWSSSASRRACSASARSFSVSSLRSRACSRSFRILASLDVAGGAAFSGSVSASGSLASDFTRSGFFSGSATVSPPFSASSETDVSNALRISAFSADLSLKRCDSGSGGCCVSGNWACCWVCDWWSTCWGSCRGRRSWWRLGLL